MVHLCKISRPSTHCKNWILYSSGSWSSHCRPRDHYSWNKLFANIAKGAVKPNGSNSREKKLSTILLVTQTPSGREPTLKEKTSDAANHFIPSTVMDAACKHLSWNSLCNTSATSALLDTHFASGILACFITEEASWMMLQASPVESAPVNRSSTYRLSFSSCTAWEGEQVAKWCFTVAFNRKGLEQLPKGTRRNLLCLTSPSRFQRNLCTSRSPGLTLICKKGFSTSAVMATFHRRNLKRISVRLLSKQGPTSIQSFNDTPL